MNALVLLTLGALLVFALTMLSNIALFPRLRRQAPYAEAPLVSICVPARNEAPVIAATVRALLQQTYPNYELIILDDASTDGTGDIVQQAGRGDARLRLVQGLPLPTGWMGKSWACHNLAQHAQGSILVFTDADTQWQPDALNALVVDMQQRHADLYTVWPTQQTITWSERLTVPLMALVILGYLPIIMTHYSPFASFAAANGQCMAWRREAYQRIGGHSAVANNVLDDVALARRAKSLGLRLRMADAKGYIVCRMYASWLQVRNGYAKNILAGYGNSVPALLLGTLFHWLVFLAPWLWLTDAQWQAWALAAIALGLLLRALSAAFTHQRVWDALWMPISVLLMTRIAFHSLYWHYTGGMRWKGRVIDPHQHPAESRHHA